MSSLDGGEWSARVAFTFQPESLFPQSWYLLKLDVSVTLKMVYLCWIIMYLELIKLHLFYAVRYFVAVFLLQEAWHKFICIQCHCEFSNNKNLTVHMQNAYSGSTWRYFKVAMGQRVSQNNFVVKSSVFFYFGIWFHVIPF
jgi:hypothetical protein